MYILSLSMSQVQAITKESFASVKTKITSEELMYYPDKQLIIFNKNVHVQRPDVELTAKKLTIYLTPSKEKDAAAANSLPSSLNTGEIKSIIAEDNVHITREKHIATCDKATYTQKTGILLLEGSPVLTDGENTITGDSIRYYTEENRSEVIGGKNKRIEAVFSSKERLLKEKGK